MKDWTFWPWRNVHYSDLSTDMSIAKYVLAAVDSSPGRMSLACQLLRCDGWRDSDV